MNRKLQELFDGLNHLCETNEAFYFSEQSYEDGKYTIRSYAYRLASWTDFQLPFAKDCRGTAFVLDNTGKWNLFCRSYQKFFNLGEGISKVDYIKNNTPISSFEKLDGSLILVGKINDKLVAKSKTSINSDHAKRAQELIDSNEKLTQYLYDEITDGLTPVMELVGPGDFRIVLPYKEDELVYLGSVEQVNYNVYPVAKNLEEFNHISGIRCAKINNFTWDELTNIQETSKPDIEGFVVQTEDGFVKIKVQSYVHLHHLKDNVNNEKSLVNLILEDSVDDLMGQFQDDPDILKYITDVQTKLGHHFNHLVIEFKELRRQFFNEFKEDKKKFAMKYCKTPKNTGHLLFHSVMASLRESFRDVNQVAEEQIKIHIQDRCRTMDKAKEYLERI